MKMPVMMFCRRAEGEMHVVRENSLCNQKTPFALSLSKGRMHGALRQAQGEREVIEKYFVGWVP